MRLDTNSKESLALLPWLLPFSLVLPYAAVASNFRGLLWVWEIGYSPFWILLCLLLLLSAAASVFLWKLQDIGITLFRVGVVLAALQTTYLAMSERRHALLLLVFALFAIGVFLGEKMKKVLTLPYYDSKRRWWESYPKGIPGLSVELSSENGDTAIVRLSNFGLAGCFVFSEDEEISFVPRFVRVFSSEQATLLEAEVEPVLRTSDRFGWGLRFSRSAADGDWSKDLQDYLGFLRRSGYEVA